MSGRAFRCEVCDLTPLWRIGRVGDVATSWACDEHLSAVCERLQRDFEITKLTVWLAPKASEWAEIERTLAAVGEPNTQEREA